MEDLVTGIRRLKSERNAIILAHNYTSKEVQEIADLTGDSLGLSIEASKTDADIIVFCGVTFMGETAKILSPNKKVLLPNPEAGCDMAMTCNAQDLSEMKKKHPDATVVGYVNTTASTKTEMDVCCTSGNAMNVVKQIDNSKILFVPDKNLGSYVAKHNPDKEIILWDGCCPIHDSLTVESIQNLIAKYPDAVKMAHPECKDDILKMMDYVGSTEAILKEVKKSDRKQFIIITEVGMKHRLDRECPDKEFIFPEEALCKPMKYITLQSIHDCLLNLTGEVILDSDVIEKAYAPVKRMIEIL